MNPSNRNLLPRTVPGSTVLTDALLALDPNTVAFLPPRLQHVDLSKNPSQIGFGILHLGKALLRIADGSETLIDDQSGLHYLGSDQATVKELQAREWQIYDLSPYEQGQLERLGIEQRDFPIMAYEIPYHRMLHPYGRQRMPWLLRGVAGCRAHNRLPAFSDMDPTSRKYLEDLFGGINLRRNRVGHVTPPVRVGRRNVQLAVSTSLIRDAETGECCDPESALGLIYSMRGMAAMQERQDE